MTTAGTVTEGQTREERELRIAQIHKKDIKKPALAAQKRAATLREALADQPPISRRQLRELVRAYPAPVVSLYLDFGPIGGNRRPELKVFHSLRHNELERRREYVAGLPRLARDALDIDLRAIEQFLAELEPDRARALVLFKCADLLVRAVELSVRVPNRLVIDPDPFIEPLEEILESEHRVLVVHVESDRAHFYVYQFGTMRELDTESAFVPSARVDRSRPGAVQRHRQTHEHWHLRETAQIARRFIDEQEGDVVIIARPEGQLAGFRDMLSADLRDRVIAEIHPSPAWNRHDWEEAVQTALDERRAIEEASAMEPLPLLQSRGRVVAGLSDVIDAANLFQARELFVRDDLTAPGSVCPEHHFLSLTEGGDCPFCGQRMLATEDVVDELIEISWLHGVDTVVVRRRGDLLNPYQGIAAVTYGAA